MTFGLTPSGFNRKRLVDIVTDIETALKLVFGENIDLNAESGFGQFVGIMSEEIANEWESQENIYNSEYPSTSQENQLSNVVMFNGLERQDAIYSTLPGVTIVGISGTVIPAGSQASVTFTGKIFETDDEVTIPGGGSATVDMTALESGAIEAVIGTLVTITTPIYGWTSITNPIAAVVGRDEETDPALRIRREASVLASGQNLEDSLYGQLLDLDDVTGALVISNRTAAPVGGIPAYQFLSVVLGGVAADIAAIIWSNTPQGIASYGTTNVVHVDAQGFDQDVKFTRPSEIDIYFKVTITTSSDYPSSGDDDIKSAIVAYGISNFSIGDDVILSQFYTAINTVDGILTIDLRIGLAPAPVGTSNLTIDNDEISAYDVSQVTVV